jgi:hypothetical protein
VPLSLDLYYLLTVWANKPLAEQFALAWTMRELHGLPTLDSSTLSADGGWTANEIVSLSPCEIGHEDLTRISSPLTTSASPTWLA